MNSEDNDAWNGTYCSIAAMALMLSLVGCAGQQASRPSNPELTQSISEARQWLRETLANRSQEPSAENVNAESSGDVAVNTSDKSDAPPKDDAPKSTTPTLTPLSQLGENPTLEVVLRLAAQNSPMIQAAGHRWQASTHKRPQDVALPDPKVEATYFVRQNFDRYMVTLSQEIPYPGKLIIAGKVADKETQAAYLRYQMSVRNVLADAKETYFELYYIDRAQVVTSEIEKLYERYAALAAGGKELAKPKLPEQFRAESQRAQLGYDLVLLKEMRSAQVERLRAAMGMKDRVAIGAVDDLPEPAALELDFEKLNDVSRAHNQELAAAGIEIEKTELQAKLARRAPIPNVMIGGSYSQEVNRRETNPLGVMVGVTIPIWVNKYKAMAREADEMAAAAKSDADAAQLQTRSDLAGAYFKLKNSARLVQLYRDTLLPQARQALQSAEELYRKGDANLASVLETTSTVHNFELAHLRAVADFYQGVARIERLLGTALEMKPAPAASQNTEPAKGNEK